MKWKDTCTLPRRVTVNTNFRIFQYKLLHNVLYLKDALSGLRQFLATKSHLKMMKNAFYFNSKALFVLKIFKFLSWLFYHVCKRLEISWRHSLVNKLFLIHISPNISRSKGNEKMKYEQLIECNMRNIFLKKSYTKRGGETSPRPFPRKLKLSISLDQ